ncbi:TetR/AcrR family transcriptional regulator [uncultured Ruthenibacterium sp.]|uniref:TetR/AcrR family transcriptional regulator n=1 Tax=uncultured Ruthenibacterium sp. TaxID=1905347 RepID=UPI00349E7255
MDALRDKCIQATFQLCSQEGLDFTMSALAARLGVSKKTLYVLFDSKESLLLEMVEVMFAQVKQSEAQVLADSSLSLTEQIRRLVIVLPESFKTLNWSRLQGVEEKYPTVYRSICQHLESGWAPTLELLERGIQTGELRPFSIGIFRSVVEGSMEYFLSSDALAREGIDYVNALEQMMDLLMEGIVQKQEEHT